MAFEASKAELAALGVSVVAASVDPPDKAKLVADEVSFPVGHGVTRDIADAVGAFWEERRSIIQPSELVLNEEGRVLASSYSAGPIGRIDPADVVRFVRFVESRKR